MPCRRTLVPRAADGKCYHIGEHHMKKGDHIRVKNGTNDPDFKGKDLSGYTGYIEDIDVDNFVSIVWDESTIEEVRCQFDKKV
jgi:hypothetical protein